MSNTGKNAKQIENAFKMAMASVKDKSYRAIAEGTKEGYRYALDTHRKAKHELHLTLGGDFGYAVARDGNVKKYEVVEGKVEIYATAEKALGEHIDNAPNDGVLGVVSAGMESAPYNDKWEEGLLKSAFKKARDKAISEIGK